MMRMASLSLPICRHQAPSGRCNVIRSGRLCANGQGESGPKWRCVVPRPEKDMLVSPEAESLNTTSLWSFEFMIRATFKDIEITKAIVVSYFEASEIEFDNTLR